jgi:uncharacterized membrane protein
MGGASRFGPVDIHRPTALRGRGMARGACVRTEDTPVSQPGAPEAGRVRSDRQRFTLVCRVWPDQLERMDCDTRRLRVNLAPDPASCPSLAARLSGPLLAAPPSMPHPDRDESGHPTAENIRAIVEVERQAHRESSLGERIGQAISDLVGTMVFVTVQSLAMVAWIAWNGLAPQAMRFDPYPYGLMTFIVSLEGVLIATFVLIAQNRMSRQSDQRDHLNLQISLLAEQEMTLMLKLLRRVCDKLEIPAESEEEERAEKLSEETNVYELVNSLRRELPQGEGDKPGRTEH